MLKRWSLPLALLTVLALPVLAMASEGHPSIPGAELSAVWVIPFVCMLLSIAIMPLALPHIWHHHFGKISVFWGLAFLIPCLVVYGFNVAFYEFLHAILLEYIPFIVLLFALFTVAGGVRLKGSLVGTPVVNTGILAVGTILASWMGTTGAAIATVIGQAFGALAGFLFHHKHNKEVNIRLSDCRPDGHIILDIYRIGFPSILMVGIGSLTNYLMNRILMAFTSTAVALYGAYFKLQSFFFMPVFGLNNGIVPIVGYNYGARKKERIYRTIRYGVLYAVCILAVGLLLFEAIPGVLLQAFSPSEHMLAIGIPALRKIAIHFPIAAFCIVGGAVCQALGKSLYSFFTSVLRQVVALIPAAYLLSLTGNVGNVWWCFPIAEVVSACATAFFLRRALRNMDRELTLAEGQ